MYKLLKNRDPIPAIRNRYVKLENKFCYYRYNSRRKGETDPCSTCLYYGSEICPIKEGDIDDGKRI